MMVMAAILVVPFGISFIYRFPSNFSGIFDDPEKLGFIVAILASAACGYFLARIFRTNRQLEGIREGFTIVSVGWLKDIPRADPHTVSSPLHFSGRRIGVHASESSIPACQPFLVGRAGGFAL